MSALLRFYVALAVLLSPSLAASPRAQHDWTPRILVPSEWDWLPQAAHLPNLGTHPVERKP